VGKKPKGLSNPSLRTWNSFSQNWVVGHDISQSNCLGISSLPAGKNVDLLPNRRAGEVASLLGLC
jgi:hypothetical protein